MSNVEPIKGERDRYYVKSFGSSHDSEELYLVDMSKSEFGCSCKNWEFNGRLIWKELKRIGGSPNEACYCKHMKEVDKYRKTWERMEENAKEMIGQWVVCNLDGKWIAGEVLDAKPDERHDIEPEYVLSIRGRSGKIANVKKNLNRAFFYCHKAEALHALGKI